MASIFTPNIQLEEPGRGDLVGVWDTPVNSNMTLLDLVVGGVANIALNNSPVVLSAAQFQSQRISFNSTLTGNVPIIFPSTFNKSYVIRNATTGSSAFVITLASTVAGGQVIACPPGDVIHCYCNNGALQYVNLGRVGTYWDYAGSSVPAWVTACTIPPFLNCDGSTFNPATYPALAVILGGNTLPDARGRFRAALNEGTGRITTAGGGVDGNTPRAAGSSQTMTIAQANLPNVNFVVAAGQAVTVTGTLSRSAGTFGQGLTGLPVQANQQEALTMTSVGTVTNTGTAASGGSGTPVSVIPPTYIGGITMIRAG